MTHSCTIADMRAAYHYVTRGSTTQVVFYKGLKIKITPYIGPDHKARVYVSINPPGHITCGFVAWSFKDLLDTVKYELTYWKYVGVV